MGFFSRSKDSSNVSPLNWVKLTSEVQINELLQESEEKTIIFFKHSTRCSISSMAKSRLESKWNLSDEVVPVYLDLLTYRPISNKLAEIFSVEHQSPQIIVVREGKAIDNFSHSQISVEAIKESI